MGSLTALTGARILDGDSWREDSVLLLDGPRIHGIADAVPPGATQVDLGGGLLAPGYVDLQVNGGGGVMFNDAPEVATLETMAAAHAGLGATAILPTLITDTPEITYTAIDAVEAAIARGVPGILGLHLEGPHLSTARKGAHDPALIRPMAPADLDLLCRAASRLPVLKITVAPESVTPAQIAAMAAAGILVSLGHSDCSRETAAEAAAAGARCVTHLFNAMSQLGSREPGLVGAALDTGALSCGLIADTVHVHPATMGAAIRAKRGPGAVFLVSDAMAPAGSDITGFTLNGRRIRRHDGRLTLEDGTLAGADLDLTTAVANVAALGVPLEQALNMASAVPAALIGHGASHGRIAPGRAADLVHLDAGGRLSRVWQNGREIAPAP